MFERDLKLNNLKGLIAEEICKFHFKKIGFNIINSGKEWQNQDLADKLFEQKPKDNNHTLNIFNNIIAKLPDMMIWKDGVDDIQYKYVEVKFRSHLDSKIFSKKITRNKHNYLSYKIISEENDVLNLYKYMVNLERLMKLQNSELTDLRQIEFYIYLIFNDQKNDTQNIYFGKVYGSKDTYYKVYFFEPDEVNNFVQWNNYKSIANHLIEKNIIKDLYNKLDLFSNEDYTTIKNIVLNTIFSK